MKQKDERFKVMNEILAGMKVIKLYAWEPSFEDQVLNYRGNELYNIKYANYINAFGSMCWLLSPYLVRTDFLLKIRLAIYILIHTLAKKNKRIFNSIWQVSLATFAAYVLSGNALDANKAFVTLSLINLLNFPMSLLPLGVANTVQVSSVSVQIKLVTLLTYLSKPIVLK